MAIIIREPSNWVLIITNILSVTLSLDIII